jgi:transcriptional regulator with XRE-family HTH domain
MGLVKRERFTDQIRQAVRTSGLSRYRIGKDTGIDQASLSRFMSGKGGLSMDNLDKLAELLRLSVLACPILSRPRSRSEPR